MKIDQAKIEIRPRIAWAAIDLGILLGMRHLSLLVRSWFVVFFPIYLILLYLLWDYPSWIAVILWWLKPIFDRVPLYILSRSIFAPSPTVKETTIYWWKNLRFQIVGDLVFRRISLVRSYLLPIDQLEKAPRKFASKRKQSFLRADSKAGWLTIVFLHIETFLIVGILTFIYFMLPGYSLWSDLDWLDPFEFDFQESFFWAYHLATLVYFCVLSVTESLYVSCGFSLYLNRRIIHEGWDLELGFKRLVKRISSMALLMMIASVSFVALQTPTVAAEAPYHTQQLDAKKAIKALLEEPPFREVTEKRSLQRKGVKKEEGKKRNQPISFDRSAGSASLMGNVTQLVVWGAVVIIVVVFIWYAKEMLPMFQGQRTEKLSPEKIMRFRGHEITPDTLPDDILKAFETTWQHNRREALGLLYRYLISQLVHHYQIPLKESHTENEVIHLVIRLNDQPLADFTKMMTKYWQYVAYGGYEPSMSDKEEMIVRWQEFLRGRLAEEVKATKTREDNEGGAI